MNRIEIKRKKNFLAKEIMKAIDCNTNFLKLQKKYGIILI